MIAANNLREEGAGFATDTNILTLITKDREIQLSKMSKEEASVKLLDELMEIYKSRHHSSSTDCISSNS
jgi:phosphopantothenoylcysteine decarboxylase/phosphopantothenate--cysteine ligase